MFTRSTDCRQKDIASDNESAFLLLMKHIWLCEMFLERGGRDRRPIPSFDTTIRVNALYITLA